MNSRKRVNTTINNIKNLKNSHEYLEQDLVRLEGQASYNKMQKFYDNALEKLTSEISLLPLGHRYTGTFYVKKPYSQPIEYQKLNASAFMREDLVSWQIEDIEEYKYSYLRAIYKKPNDDPGSEITREQAEPVYETQEL